MHADAHQGWWRLGKENDSHGQIDAAARAGA